MSKKTSIAIIAFIVLIAIIIVILVEREMRKNINNQFNSSFTLSSGPPPCSQDTSDPTSCTGKTQPAPTS